MNSKLTDDISYKQRDTHLMCNLNHLMDNQVHRKYYKLFIYMKIEQTNNNKYLTQSLKINNKYTKYNIEWVFVTLTKI